MGRGRAVARFTYEVPSLDSYWRSIVLFGQNVASYRFALAGALLEIADGPDAVGLEDLAVPFARRVADHLRTHDKQGTSQRSRFLDACREFNRGNLDCEALRAKTVELGFTNVIDAFHVVTDSETAADQFGAEVMPPSGGLKMELVVAGSNVRSLGSTAQAFELVRKVVDQSGGRRVDAVVSIGRRSWPVSASLRSDGRTAHLRFTDGSHFSVRDPGATPDESPEPLDVGISLLEPVTVRELRGVEQIIGQLWASVEEAALTETQEAQIILMADLIKAQQVSSNAGQTPRWQIVGAVRSALTYLVREAPKDALAWWKLAELLARIDWHNLAQALPT